MCGSCYCQGCHNCGCKYNCDGVVCDKSFPTCCCKKPPSQCGCCMTWDDQDACCLNGNYYITFPLTNTGLYYVNSDGEQVLYTQGYIVFQFINCISCTAGEGVSTDQGIFDFMVWWNQCQLISVGFQSGNDFTAVCSKLTTTNPGSTSLNVTVTFNGGPNCCSNINNATNCYFWPLEVDGNITEWTENSISLNPSGFAFTSYCSVGSCDFAYPLYTAGTCMY